MIIDLLPPYDKDFNRAYLVNSQGRNSVCLYNTESKLRHTISYARYLMSTHLNRFLTDDEHVDHIDNDKSNDVISNLQILTLAENNKKQAKLKGKRMVRYSCPICSKEFSLSRRLSHLTSKSKTSATCSKSCGGKISRNYTGDKIIMLYEYVDYD